MLIDLLLWSKVILDMESASSYRFSRENLAIILRIGGKLTEIVDSFWHKKKVDQQWEFFSSKNQDIKFRRRGFSISVIKSPEIVTRCYAQ